MAQGKNIEQAIATQDEHVVRSERNRPNFWLAYHPVAREIKITQGPCQDQSPAYPVIQDVGALAYQPLTFGKVAGLVLCCQELPNKLIVTGQPENRSSRITNIGNVNPLASKVKQQSTECAANRLDIQELLQLLIHFLD